MIMDIGEVLQRAWQIIWKHKALWIFGILASCGSGGGGGGNTGYQFSQDEFPRGFERTLDIADWQIALIIAAVVIFILFVIILVAFISTVGRIGLIRGTVEAELGMESITFGYLFNSSLPYFWRVFFLNLLIWLAGFAAVILLVVASIPLAIVTLGIGVICLVCLAIPLGALVGVIIEQANIAMVVEDLGISDAIVRGWEVFRDNIGTMIVMGLILVIGAGLVSFLIAAPLVTVLIPIVTGAIIGEQAVFAGVLGALACFVIYLPVLIVLGGIVRSYVGSAWTLTYLRLTQGGAEGTAEAELPAPI
jgi:hypothetical protein